MNEDRYFITGITQENEQSVVDKLERSGFTNWWSLPEDAADYIYVSVSLGNQYMRMWYGDKMSVNVPKIAVKDYLCDEVSK